MDVRYMPEKIFSNKKADTDKLLLYGFTENQGGYIYSTDFAEGHMQLVVTLSKSGEADAKVIDKGTGEEYVLHKVKGARGAFVGQVKREYEDILSDISAKCFEPDVFKSADAKQVIEYIKNTYGDELEFLWKRFPNNAVFRRKDTGKWYGALLVLSKRKLGMDSDEIIDILDLRINPEDMEAVIDNKKYYPGYHMNKKHWCTICLDGSVSMEEICQRIDNSYNLAEK